MSSHLFRLFIMGLAVTRISKVTLYIVQGRIIEKTPECSGSFF